MHYARAIIERIFRRRSQYLLTLLAISAVGIFLPEAAFAGDISNTVCSLVSKLGGGTARAIASTAIIGIGVGALFGKVSWNMSFVIAGGIALVFGAASVMTVLGFVTPGGACAASQSSFTFQCVGSGVNSTAQGNLFDAQSTMTSNGSTDASKSVTKSTAAANDSIFGKVLDTFRQTVGGIMSTMYCGFTGALKSTLQVALTVFVAVFGIAVATGMSNLTVKEAGILLFKVALIWAFASTADYSIGIGYKFFVNVATEGSNIVLGAMVPDKPVVGYETPNLSNPDAVITGGVGSIVGSNQQNTTKIPPWCLVYVIALALLLLLFMPLIIIFVMIMIIQYIGMYTRCLVGYLTALVLISFLFILTPLFVSFALFRTTEPLFQQWIKYLTTFAIQMIVLFGFLALLALIPLGAFINEILSLLRDYDETYGHWLLSFPFHFCGVCDYTIHPATFSPSYTAASVSCDRSATESLSYYMSKFPKASGLPLPQAAATQGFILGSDHSTDTPADSTRWYVISLPAIMEHGDLLKFIIAQVMALYLISRVVEDYLKKAPEFAKTLGGLPFAAGLGGAGSAPSGSGASINYVGAQSIAAGTQGFKNRLVRDKYGKRYSLNPLKSWNQRRKGAFGGFKEGFLHGSTDERSAAGKESKHKINRARLRKDAALAEYMKAGQLVKANLERMEALKKDPSQISKLAEATKNYHKALELEKKRGAKLTEELLELEKAQLSGGANQLSGIKSHYEGEGDKDDPIWKNKTAFEKFRDSKQGQKAFLTSKSSLDMNQFSSDDETKKRIDEGRKHQKEEEMYGHRIKDNPDNSYYMMKLPPDVSASDGLTTLQDASNRVAAIISSLQNSLDSGNYPPEKKAEIQGMIDNAQRGLQGAQSESQIDKAHRDALSIANYLT